MGKSIDRFDPDNNHADKYTIDWAIELFIVLRLLPRMRVRRKCARVRRKCAFLDILPLTPCAPHVPAQCSLKRGRTQARFCKNFLSDCML